MAPSVSGDSASSMKAIALIQRTFARVCLASVAFASLHAQPNRIGRNVDESRRAPLSGSIHPQATEANEVRRVDASKTISNVTLALAPTDEQRAALDEFLIRQQTPGSPDYHHWITPEEYADRFGVNQSDVAAISSWLQDKGLTITGTARSRTWISVS